MIRCVNWQGRVTAQHCRAMSLYPENYFRKLVQLAKEAEIGFVTDHTSDHCIYVSKICFRLEFQLHLDRTTLQMRIIHMGSAICFR